MSKIRDVLVHIFIEAAKGSRQCARNKKQHKISKGELCLCIKSGSPSRVKSYCHECAKDMLVLADTKLKQIFSDLKL